MKLIKLFLIILTLLISLYLLILIFQKYDKYINSDVKSSSFKTCTFMGIDFDLTYHYYYNFDEVSQEWINQKENEIDKWQNYCPIGKLKK